MLKQGSVIVTDDVPKLVRQRPVKVLHRYSGWRSDPTLLASALPEHPISRISYFRKINNPSIIPRSVKTVRKINPSQSEGLGVLLR